MSTPHLDQLLSEHSADFGRKMTVNRFMLRWLNQELVNALLRPVYVIWRKAHHERSPLDFRYECRFTDLVSSAPTRGVFVSFCHYPDDSFHSPLSITAFPTEDDLN